MTKIQAKEQTIGTGKETDVMVTNSKPLTEMGNRSKFDLVAGGTCPHCGSRLSVEVKTTGVGLKRTCIGYAHTWYLNREIKTTKCLTCSYDRKRKNLDANKASSYNNPTSAGVAE